MLLRLLVNMNVFIDSILVYIAVIKIAYISTMRILGYMGLIVTRSNLVVTWKDRPQMSIIS
jgi:hypothetical protein